MHFIRQQILLFRGFNKAIKDPSTEVKLVCTLSCCNVMQMQTWQLPIKTDKNGYKELRVLLQLFPQPLYMVYETMVDLGVLWPPLWILNKCYRSTWELGKWGHYFWILLDNRVYISSEQPWVYQSYIYIQHFDSNIHETMSGEEGISLTISRDQK